MDPEAALSNVGSSPDKCLCEHSKETTTDCEIKTQDMKSNQTPTNNSGESFVDGLSGKTCPSGNCKSPTLDLQADYQHKLESVFLKLKASSSLSDKTIYETSDDNKTSDTASATATNTNAPNISFSFTSTNMDITNNKNPTLMFNEQPHNSDYQLELAIVYSIINLCKRLNTLIDCSSYSMSNEVFDEGYNEVLNLMKFFKYHFQLPLSSPHFAFKNYSYLFQANKVKMFMPILQLIFSAINFKLYKQDKLKNCFCSLVTFCLMDRILFDFMLNECQNEMVQKFASHVLDNPLENHSSLLSCDSSPGVISFFVNFQRSVTFEKSTLLYDKSNDFLMDALFANFKNYSFETIIDDIILVNHLCELILQEQNLNSTSINKYLTELTLFYNKSRKNQELVSVYCRTHEDLIKKLHLISKSFNSNTSKSLSILDSTKIATSNYLLSSATETLISFFSIYDLSKNAGIQRIYFNRLNSNYQKILGLEDISVDKFAYDVNDCTFKIIFEVITHNLKVDLLREKNLLLYLKASLFTIDHVLKNHTNDSFISLHLLLQEIGSTLSLHSIFEILQFILSRQTNTGKAYYYNHAKIIKELESHYGFDCIPPMARSNFAFENTIDVEQSLLGNGDNIRNEKRSIINEDIIQLFQDILKCNSTTTDYLLNECLLLCSSIKSVIYDLLLQSSSTEAPADTNFMLFSNDNFKFSESKSSILYEYRLKNFSSIPVFEFGSGLDFKITSEIVELSLITNICVSIFAFKQVPSTKSINDDSNNESNNSVTHLTNNNIKPSKNLLKLDIVYHFVIDSLTSFIMIYKEFGLFSTFKFFKYIISRDLSTLPICSQILSDLLKNPKLLQIIENTNTMNLFIRQFIELYDDKESSHFKELNKFLKKNPSPIKPSKINKGNVTLNVSDFLAVLSK